MEQNRLTGTSLSTRTLFQLKCNGSLYFAEVKCELPAGTSLHAIGVPCFLAGVARLWPPRTEAAMPLSVSVRDGHVSVLACFARLADSSTARIRPPLLASRGARHAKQRRGK